MRKFELLLVLLFFIWSPSASALNNACLPSSKMDGDRSRECKCGKNLSGQFRSDARSKIFASASLPLVAVCDYRKQDWGYDGSFYFSGSVDVTGTIRRSWSETFGDTFSFVVNKNSAAPLPSNSSNQFRLPGTERDIQRFRSPSLPDENACLEAPVELRIRKLEIMEDAGTDFGGTFLTAYDVLRVGKYVKCPSNG